MELKYRPKKEPNRFSHIATSVAHNEMSRKHLSDVEKGRILAWRECDKTFSEIARLIGRNPSTVRRFVQRHKRQKDKPRSETRGRPSVIDARTGRLILRHSCRFPNDSARAIRVSNDIQASDRTLRRFLSANDYNGRMTHHVLDITQENRDKRVEWCLAHADMPLSYWRNVIFSDEKWFLRTTHRRHWVRYNPRHHPPETLETPKKHHPRRLMVWGCFSYNGCGRLYRINGSVNSEEYCRILTHALLPSATELELSSPFIFQQDNAKPHTSRKTMTYFDELAIDETLYLMEWPAQSPDLNPIENLWSIFDQRVGERTMLTDNELWEILEKTWDEISKDAKLLRSLIDSMPHRIKAVIESEGGPTKY